MKSHTLLLQFGALVLLLTLNVVTFMTFDVTTSEAYLGRLKSAYTQDSLLPAAKRSSQIYDLKKVELESDADHLVDEFTCEPLAEPENKTLAAELVDIKMPKTYGENEYIMLNMSIKNAGNVTWHGDSHECVNYTKMRLGNSQDPSGVHPLWNDFNFLNNNWTHNGYKNRISMKEDEVEPGEVATFTVWVETPETTITKEVEVVVDEKTGEETKEVTLHKWVYERYTFNPVYGDEWLELDIPVTMKLGDVPEKEAAKTKYLNAKLNNYSLKDYPGEKNMYITLSNQKGYLRYGEKAFHEYIISSGAWDSPTPVGDHFIYNKQELRVGGKAPHYRMPYWMGLRINGGPFEGYGLHEVPYLGVSRETSAFYQNGLHYDLGRNVSHGCVRSAPEDAEFAYQFGELGMSVKVRRGNEDELIPEGSVIGTVDRGQHN